MKTAQELRSGNVFMVGKDPMVVLKSEYSKGGRPRRLHRQDEDEESSQRCRD